MQVYTPIIISCDRCLRDIPDAEFFPPTANFPGGATSGYYEVRPGSLWNKYSNPGEINICDDCMFHDSRYIEVYGIRY